MLRRVWPSLWRSQTPPTGARRWRSWRVSRGWKTGCLLTSTPRLPTQCRRPVLTSRRMGTQSQQGRQSHEWTDRSPRRVRRPPRTRRQLLASPDTDPVKRHTRGCCATEGSMSPHGQGSTLVRTPDRCCRGSLRRRSSSRAKRMASLRPQVGACRETSPRPNGRAARCRPLSVARPPRSVQIGG
jgi:hypothetical protein